MSYGIVRIQKMSKGSVKGIEIHDRRVKEGISHTNKDIDWKRSNQNYDLHHVQKYNFNQTIKERIKELNLPKAIRKDAVVMAQVLVTSENEFFKGLSKVQQEQFFKDSYVFLTDRYGKENVISATVHLDERTPHMHFNFVPVTSDGRLSAKSLLTRQSLTEQQTAFYEQVGKIYGLERGIQGGKKKHLEVAELKAQTALKSVSMALEKIQNIKDNMKPLEAEYEAKKAYVREYDKASEISMMYPAYAEQKKSLFGKKTVTVPKDKWEQRHISVNEKNYLQKAIAEFEKAMTEFQKTSSAEYITQLERKIESLEQNVKMLKQQNYSLENKKGKSEKKALLANKDMNDVINCLNKVIDRLPNDVAELVVKQWEAEKSLRQGISHTYSKSHDIQR